MNDKELLELMMTVDPNTKRIPPGLKAIVEAIENRERDRIVDRILNGSQFFLAGIEPEMREAVVRRAIEPLKPVRLMESNPETWLSS